MKLISNFFKKKPKTQNENEELIDQKVVVKNKNVQQKSRSNSNVPQPKKKESSDGKGGVFEDEEEVIPTIICINNYKGLQKSDRKWVKQTGISEEVINNNFPVVLHVLNFLRKKEAIYYKYIEQAEQIAQIKEQIKEQIPSVIISTATTNNNSGGSGGSSPKPYHHNSSDDEDDKSGQLVGSHCSSNAMISTSKSNQNDSLLLKPNSGASTASGASSNTPSANGSVTPNNHIIVNTNTCSGPSYSFIYPERKKRIDANRIFIAPGIFFTFPEELEQATEKLLNEGNPKDQYKNLDFEAKGGFGSVFAAKNKNPHCSDDKHIVALKKMPHVTPKQKRMNLNEIGFMKHCRHPNIVNFLCSFQRNDELWMIMEFMEGGTLREAINNFNFCEARIAYIAREVLKGIHYLHQNSICHRDLKSSNIMISMKGDIKIIDFGLAIDFSHEKEDIHMCGSPFWMPPEQIHGNSHSLPADIWSYGVCIAEMLNRKVPHHNSRLKAMLNVALEGMVFKKEDHPDWSDEAIDFLQSCLQFDPKNRLTTSQLLQHPFLQKSCTLKEIKEILPALFMSNTLSKQGLF